MARRTAPTQKTIAIVGRPNVGKSTLFNLLTRGQGMPAITHATAGTTRDARLCPAELFGLNFLVYDTAGVEEGRKTEALQASLNQLALKAAEKADLLLFLVDGTSGVLPADRALAQRLRKFGRPVLVLLNKADVKTTAAVLPEVETLGFGTPLLIAAAHNQGLDALHEALAAHIPATPHAPAEDEEEADAQRHTSKRQQLKRQRVADEAAAARAEAEAAEAAAQAEAEARAAAEAEAQAALAETDDEALENAEDDEQLAPPERHPAPQKGQNVPIGAASPSSKNNSLKLPDTKVSGPIKLAILGRPNVGKSTLINTLLRDDVMLTGPTAGLTREAISHAFSYKNNSFTLIDTPGLRKKGKIDENGLEFLSVGQSLQAAENADIVVLVVDASEHNISKGKWVVFEQQDAQIASMVLNKFKPLVVALTKWDLVEDPESCLADVRIQLHHRLHDVHDPLAVPVCSLQGKGIKTLLEAILKVHTGQTATFSTNKLNNLLARVLAKRSPPLANGKVVSLKFIRQTSVNPPSFTFWGNRISEVSGSYKQFLRNQLADALGLQHNPIRITFRANANPYSSKKSKS